MATVVNLDEKIGKWVGSRRPPAVALKAVMQTAEESRGWKKAFGTPHIPRGVYRFKSHEEADQWLIKMLTKPMNP